MMESYLADYLRHVEMSGDFVSALVPCEVCGAREHTIVRETVDIGMGAVGKMPVVACDTCGLLYQNPRFNREFYAEYYARRYRTVLFGDSRPPPGFMDDQYFRGETLYENLERFLGGPGELLDVGSSSGGLMRAFLERGWGGLGVDPDPGYVALGKELGLPVIDGAAEDMQLEDGKYDLIVITGSLEHVYDPNVTLSLCRKAARPGSLLLLEGHGFGQSAYKQRFGHNHRRYLTASSCELFMLKHGWDPIWTTDDELCGPTRPGSVFCLGRAGEARSPAEMLALIRGGKRETPEEVLASVAEAGIED